MEDKQITLQDLFGDEILYISLVLSNEDKQMLREKFRQYKVQGGRLYCHHCTLVHTANQDKIDDEQWDILQTIANNDSVFDHKYRITLYAMGVSDKSIAYAAIIHSPELARLCMNDQPHVTIATFNGGVPSDSNQITDWTPITPIDLFTTLRINYNISQPNK